jgi:hypothetical protein
LGSNFKVSDDAGTSYQWDPAIAMDSSGNFVITWRDERNGIYNFDVYAQRYNSSRTPLGSNFKVNDDAGTTWQWEPAITMHSSGNFVITWEDYRDGSADIYAQRYNSSGIPQGSNFKVSDDTETSDQYYPVITIDASGKFLIAWQDYRNGNPDIYAQRYNSSGNSDGSNYLVSNCHDTASTAQIYPAIASNTSNIYFTWMDDRRGNWDIYAKVVDWTWTKVEEDQEVSLPNSFDLAQNYPNPFNPTTTIQFRVGSLEFGEPIHTTLKIYNILGRLVRTLIDEEKLPGNYSVVWDGKDNSNKEVTSGIYLYQLKTIDYTNTRKMVLLR